MWKKKRDHKGIIKLIIYYAFAVYHTLGSYPSAEHEELESCICLCVFAYLCVDRI